MDNERDDFRAEIRSALRRIEDNQANTDTRMRLDHDILTKLVASFAAMLEKLDTSNQRLGDHEKRLRFLERVAFGIIAALGLLQYVVNKLFPKP